MSNKVYAFDDYGNKHETMRKDEIEQSIGAGGVRECVLTGCITYNKVDINYNYTGTLPSETVISKLLAFGVNPENNKLTEAEVTSYLGLGMFSIHFYYLDAEIYVTNVNGTYLAYSKMGEGTFNVYPRKVEKFYFVKASEKTNSDEYTVKDAEHATQADKATTADSATNATNANIAKYASSDTSKGTIEERLTALGFKEGVATLNVSSGTAARNSLKKQGKYVLFNYEVNDVFCNEVTQISLTMPQEFRPKNELTIMYRFSTKPRGNDTYFADMYSTATVGTDGVIPITSIAGASIKFEIINVGWETN